MKNFYFSTALFLLTLSSDAQAPFALRCDLLRNTEQVSSHGIKVNVTLLTALQNKKDFQFASVYSQQPVFNWQLDTLIKRVTACQVLVASSAKLIDVDKSDYWDSKKINTQQTKLIYQGKKLQPGSVYYWKVKVWNEKNIPTSYSTNCEFYYAGTDSTNIFPHQPLAAEMQHAISIIKKENDSWFLDFGKDGFAQLQLHLTSDVSDSIWIEASEALESPANIQRLPGNIRYIKKELLVEKGTHDYAITWPADAKRNSRNPVQMPDYIGEVFPFRYVSILHFKGVISNGSVIRKMIFYPFDEQASSFVCSDTVLNKVWDLCRYSVKATSFSGYYVDGDRERLPYEADALINQLSHYSVDAEYTIARRSMDYVIYHPTWPTEWSLQNVLLAWNDYLYTGDDSFLKKYYTELQKKILMPLSASNALISTKAKKQADDFLESIHMLKDFDGKHGLKDIVDWPQKANYVGYEKEYGGETDGFVYTDYNAVVNAFYYRDLLLMQKIAQVLGEKEDAGFYDKNAQSVYNAFQNIFQDQHTGLIKDGDTTSHTSLHANMFALAFGLVPPLNINKVITFIKTRGMACSVYGAQFLLDALYDAGEADYALQLMASAKQRSWYNMLRAGSTITMEAWDKVYKPNLDLNHAWGSAPANIIVRKLMGVEPLTPGAEKIRIKPQLGSLRFAKLTTSTLKGMVTVDCKNRDQMELIIPGGTTVDVYMAYHSGKKKVLFDGKNIAVKPENGYIVIKDVAAGKHSMIQQ